jgi:hypothetical protein
MRLMLELLGPVFSSSLEFWLSFNNSERGGCDAPVGTPYSELLRELVSGGNPFRSF